MKLKLVGIIFFTLFLLSILPGIVLLRSSSKVLDNEEVETAGKINSDFLEPSDFFDKIPNIILEKFESSTNSRSAGLVRNPNYSSYNITCFPFYTNYSDEQYYKSVVEKAYGECKMNNESDLQEQHKKFLVSCKETSLNSYFLDPQDEEIFGFNEYQINWTPFHKTAEITLNSQQYLFIRCARREIYTYIFNSFNRSLSNLIKKRTKLLENSFTVEDSRPLSVYVLLFDSLSRQNFYRSMNETLNYLKEEVLQGEYSKTFNVYDFTLTNVIELTTIPNLTPILYGKSLKFIQQELRSPDQVNISNSTYLNIQKKYSIWNYFSNLGFLTAFSYDTTFDFLSDITGKHISAHFKFSNFWNAAKKIFGYNDFIGRQRCFGLKNAHWFGMEYMRQYFLNYNGHNRFGYSHLSPGHESTGVIKTADSDLKNHLKDIMNIYLNNSEDIFILLLSDHGRIQGKLEFDLEQFVEARLPLSFIISNKKLLSRISASQNLEINTKRLISRYDINLTLKTLAFVPYGRISEKDYSEIKDGYEIGGVKSLIREQVEDRSCFDTGAREIDCICKDYKNVSFDSEIDYIVIEVFEKLALEVVNKYRTRKLRKEGFIALNKLSFEVFEIRNEDEGCSKKYKIRFEGIEDDGGRVYYNVTGIFAKTSHFALTNSKADNLHGVRPSEIFEYGDEKFQVQIVSINLF